MTVIIFPPMTDQDELLEILQAHGQQFLGSFSPPAVSSISLKKRKRNVDAKPESRKITKVEPEEEEYEEWGGIIEETSGSEQEGEDNSDGEESELFYYKCPCINGLY